MWEEVLGLDQGVKFFTHHVKDTDFSSIEKEKLEVLGFYVWLVGCFGLCVFQEVMSQICF